MSEQFFDDRLLPNKPADYEKDFIFILKRLSPPKQALRSLRLLIPDTACLGPNVHGHGEVKFIVTTAKVSMRIGY